MNSDKCKADMKLENKRYTKNKSIKESTFQPDSISTDIELEDGGEGSIDLREITQSILDMEETQNSSHFSSSAIIPSSPPPSYEHVLAETKIAEEAAASSSAEPDGESDSTIRNEGQPLPPNPRKGVEIIHKSHKEFYRAVAKQWGITCKMSDHCRCINCQSMYFECEYDQNEQEKTDGGLGAGTPMFISEVMSGSACTLL